MPILLPNTTTAPIIDSTTAFKVKVGTFVGAGTSPVSVSGLGFTPEFVFVHKTSASPSSSYDGVFKSNLMASTESSLIRADSSTITTSITSIDVSGFSIAANDPYTNVSGVTCVYIAMTGTGTAFSNLGFSGSGINHTTVNVGIKSPQMVCLKTKSAIVGAHKFLGQDKAGVNYPGTDRDGLIYGLTDNGYVDIGPGFPDNANLVNIASVTSFGWAVANYTGYMQVGSYVGNGVSGRTISVPFQPDFVWVRNNFNVNNNPIIIKALGNPIGTCGGMDTDVQYTTVVLDLVAGGFTVGTDSGANASGITYFYWAVKSM